MEDTQDSRLQEAEEFLGRIKGYAESVGDIILIELLEEYESTYKTKIKTNGRVRS